MIECLPGSRSQFSAYEWLLSFNVASLPSAEGMIPKLASDPEAGLRWPLLYPTASLVRSYDSPHALPIMPAWKVDSDPNGASETTPRGIKLCSLLEEGSRGQESTGKCTRPSRPHRHPHPT